MREKKVLNIILVFFFSFSNFSKLSSIEYFAVNKVLFFVFTEEVEN